MKCRYKEPMEYFYLTKDNYEEFLENFFNLSCDDIIIEEFEEIFEVIE